MKQIHIGYSDCTNTLYAYSKKDYSDKQNVSEQFVNIIRKVCKLNDSKEIKIGDLVLQIKEVKENVELKKVISVLNASNSFNKEKLAKAKEIIKKLISDNRKVWVYSDVREEAEKFLKEIEK